MNVYEHDEREEEEEEEEWTDTPGDGDDNSRENREANLDAAFNLRMGHMFDPFLVTEYYRRTGWEELISKACIGTRFMSTLKKVLDALSSQQSSFDINRAVPNKTLSSEVKEITAMQMAAYHSSLDLIDLLMSYDAKVDVGCVLFAIKGMKADDPYAGMYSEEDEDEEAVKFKKLMYLQIMETLVRSGVDLNGQFGRRKQTPLLQATREGNKMIVDYLLQKRVNVSVKDYEGRNAATLAEEKGFEELAEMLKKSRQLSRLFSTNSNSSSRRERNNKEGGEVEEEVPREEACICCMDRRKEVIFAPCGHRLVCRRCFRENIGTSEAMQKCMVCKESIVSWILKVYE